MAKPQAKSEPVFRMLRLDAITVDPDRFQSRVKMDPNHVEKIRRAIVEDGSSFKSSPVHVFDVGDAKLYLVDGFHRHDGFTAAGKTEIPALVHQGADSDAVAFSVGANIQGTLLEVTTEDKKKAAMMLLKDPEWFKMSDNAIAKQCGLGNTTLKKIRMQFCDDNNIPRPTKIVHSDGAIGNYSRPRCINGQQVVIGTEYTGYKTTVAGKTLFLGRDHQIAKAKADEISAERNSRKSILRNVETASRWLLNRNVREKRQTISSALSLPSGSFASLILPGALVRIESDITFRSLATAVGDILLWRQRDDPTARAIVLCYPEGEKIQEAIRLAGELGVEFLTPEQVVEQFAGKEWPDAKSVAPDAVAASPEPPKRKLTRLAQKISDQINASL